MKIEEATCKVAPSPTQISYPLYNVKDGVIEDSPHTGVTCSPCSIESPQTQKLYITPVVEGRKKPKDPRFACLGYIQKLKAIPSTAKAILTWLVMERQWRTDRLIIVSFGLVADHFGLSRRQVIRLFQILEESGCLRMFKKGGSTRGSKREANTYSLGSLFDNLPPEETKRRPVSGMSLVPPVPLVTKMSDDQCQECHPLPIVPPIHTHTEELPTAFNKENWLNRGKAKYPNWDADNMTSAFYSGEMKGLNGNWPSFQDKCYHLRITSAKTTPAPAPAPRSWQKQASKPQDSSCESPRPKPIDYDKNPKVFEDDLYTALRYGYTTDVILSGVKDLALRESGLAKAKARIETSKSDTQNLIRSIMASTTTHPKPSKEAWIKECVRLGIEESKSSDSYEQLNRAGWLMSDGSVIKNWKQYANGIGKGEARRKAMTS